ncbi:MAG TPA: protein phosphatase 2C domain-containing protein [Burkholderiaceae bacterium]|jgi:serine/threonine protein phosphatase PrpC
MQCPKCLGLLNQDGFCDTCGLPIASFEAVPDTPRVATPMRSAPLKIDLPPDLALVSDIGRHHAENQDYGMVGRSDNGNVVIVVADGVSSSENADIASATAVTAAYNELIRASAEQPGPEVVQRAVAIAHAAVMEIPYTSSHKEEPETTIVVALVRGGVATIAWVGDSRTYTVNPAYARLITRDDSWLADAMEEGELTLQQAMADPRSHSITQCLGMLNDPIRIHVRTVKLDPGTWVLLCTDGLWNYFDNPAAMAEKLREAGQDADAFEVCQFLVRQANSAGGHDNITVGAYRYHGTNR